MTSGLFYRDPEGNEHVIGDDDCPACWRGGTLHCDCQEPKRVHAWFVDESYDSIIFGYYCEECGPVGRYVLGY